MQPLAACWIVTGAQEPRSPIRTIVQLAARWTFQVQSTWNIVQKHSDKPTRGYQLASSPAPGCWKACHDHYQCFGQQQQCSPARYLADMTAHLHSCNLVISSKSNHQCARWFKSTHYKPIRGYKLASSHPACFGVCQYQPTPATSAVAQALPFLQDG